MKVDRVGDLEVDGFGKWIVGLIVDGCSLFVVRCSLFVVRCSLFVGRVDSRRESLLFLFSFYLLPFSFLLLPDLVLRDVLRRRDFYTALVAEHDESLFIHLSFRVSELNNKSLVVALSLDTQR